MRGRPQLDLFTPDDVMEFRSVFPGALAWLQKRSAIREIESLEARSNLGQHEHEWLAELKAMVAEN